MIMLRTVHKLYALEITCMRPYTPPTTGPLGLLSSSTTIATRYIVKPLAPLSPVLVIDCNRRRKYHACTRSYMDRKFSSHKRRGENQLNELVQYYIIWVPSISKLVTSNPHICGSILGEVMLSMIKPLFFVVPSVSMIQCLICFPNRCNVVR